MSTTGKIFPTEWEVVDFPSYVFYRKRFYSAKDGKELFYVVVEFNKHDSELLAHNYSEFVLIKGIKLKPFEARTLLGAIEKFVRQIYYRIHKPGSPIEGVDSEGWALKDTGFYDIYKKDFLSTKYDDIIFKAKVVFSKFEANVLYYIYTEIRSVKVFKFKPYIARDLLNITEKFIKDVYYPYYASML